MSALAITLLYGSLALFAALGTIRRPYSRSVGLVLLLCWVASNLVYWTAFEYRPTLFPILETIFALTCARAGLLTASRVPIVLIILSMLAITLNVAVNLQGMAAYPPYIYDLGVNLIFAAQCLITGGWGMAHELGRAGDFVCSFVYRRGTAQSARSSSPDEIG